MTTDEEITTSHDSHHDNRDQDTHVKTTPHNIKNKIDVLLLNNGWNDKNERLIISIGENAASYKWMHDKSHSKYDSYNKKFSLLIILLNGILSTQTIYNDESVYSYVLVQKIFIYIVTFLSIINSFLKYQELTAQHLHSSSQYAEIYHDIQQEMCMYRKDRINAVKYISIMLKKSDNIRISSPDIDKDILNEFKKKFQNTNITLPDIADQIQKIEIITEPRVNSSTASNTQTNSQLNILTNNTEYTSRNNMKNITNLYNQNPNLANQNSFKIEGDLDDDNDDDADALHQYLKKKAMEAKTNFEYQRSFS